MKRSDIEEALDFYEGEDCPDWIDKDMTDQEWAEAEAERLLPCTCQPSPSMSMGDDGHLLICLVWSRVTVAQALLALKVENVRLSQLHGDIDSDIKWFDEAKKLAADKTELGAQLAAANKEIERLNGEVRYLLPATVLSTGSGE